MANANFQGSVPAGYIAGGTIAQYRAVVLDSTAGQVVAGSAITQVAIGASLQSASSGETVPVQRFGKAKLTASAPISLGAQVMITASGAGKVSTAAGATAYSIGIAEEAAGADGDIIEVTLIPSVAAPANS